MAENKKSETHEENFQAESMDVSGCPGAKVTPKQ
jgi:hypothetical protein